MIDEKEFSEYEKTELESDAPLTENDCKSLNLTFNLSEAEHQERKQAEARIRAGQASVFDMGAALLVLRHKLLYRDSYTTFAERMPGSPLKVSDPRPS